MKYVISSKNEVVLSNDFNIHKTMSHGMEGIPVSAGFCSVNLSTENDGLEINCFGESISLDLKSREGDNEIIYRFLSN